MEFNYKTSETKEDIVDYFLGILNDCSSFKSSDAEDKFLTLERMLREEGVGKDIIKKLDNTRNIFSKLNDYLTHCKEHEEYFNQLRSSLAEIQEARSNRYNNMVQL